MAIPIIGEVKYQVVTWYPTANIICKCVPGVMNFIICTGVGAVTHCPRCGDGYSIQGMNLERGVLNPIIEMHRKVLES